MHRKTKGENPPPEVKRADEDSSDQKSPFPGQTQGSCRLAKKTAVEEGATQTCEYFMRKDDTSIDIKDKMLGSLTDCWI